MLNTNPPSRKLEEKASKKKKCYGLDPIGVKTESRGRVTSRDERLECLSTEKGVMPFPDEYLSGKFLELAPQEGIEGL